MPYLVFGPVAGIIADRCSRRAILIAGDLCRAVLTALILVAITLGTPWLIILLVFAHALVGSTYEAARFAVLPLLVDRRDLRTANGFVQVTYSLGQLAGPVLVSVSLLAGGGFWVLAVDAVAFVLSAAGVRMIRTPLSVAARAPRASPRTELREMLGLLRAPLLLGTFAGVAVANLFTGSLTSYLPTLLADSGITSSTAGLVMAGGIAGLAMSVLLRRHTFAGGRAPGIGLALRAAACLALALLPDGRIGLVCAVFLWALSSLGTTMFQAGTTSVRQLAARPEQMGRVGSLARSISWSTLPLSGVLAAFVVGHGEVRTVFLLAGVVLSVLVVAMWKVWTPVPAQQD